MNDTHMETANAIERYMLDVGRRARAASRVVGRAETRTKNGALLAIAAALEGFESDWTEIARDLVRRRFGPAGPVDLAQRRKAADLLARRGFSTDSIRAATWFDPDE